MATTIVTRERRNEILEAALSYVYSNVADLNWALESEDMPGMIFCQGHYNAKLTEDEVQAVLAGIVEEQELPFGGSHAPDCPYVLSPAGECLCWRSDPEQNPELHDG